MTTKKTKGSSLYEQVYKAVEKIPNGKVATYAQIGLMIGNPYYARLVGNALHKNPYFGKVPCHRVVNAKGKLADNFVFGGKDQQAEMLKNEGVEVIDGYVNLKKYQMR